MRQRFRVGRVVILLAIVALAAAGRSGPTAASPQAASAPPPSNVESYARDERALIALGKALFWDVQLSSDSTVACASCHFHAGADHRLYNQLSSSEVPAGAPRLLTPADFPFAREAMEAGRRIASAGIHAGRFVAIGRNGLPDAAAQDGGERDTRGHYRQVDSRNAPSVINAAFYFRGFWDGRASDTFNGRTPYGDDDPTARVLVDADGQLSALRVRIEHASLASQAVEPPIQSTEMSYDGRSWPSIGKRVLAARPLATQVVAQDDSVLGCVRQPRRARPVTRTDVSGDAQRCVQRRGTGARTKW